MDGLFSAVVSDADEVTGAKVESSSDSSDVIHRLRFLQSPCVSLNIEVFSVMY